MEPIELIGCAVVLIIAFLLIAYGVMKLKGITLLQRGRHPDPPEDDDLWEFPPDLDINTMKPAYPLITKKEIQDDFQKEDDLE